MDLPDSPSLPSTCTITSLQLSLVSPTAVAKFLGALGGPLGSALGNGPDVLDHPRLASLSCRHNFDAGRLRSALAAVGLDHSRPSKLLPLPRSQQTSTATQSDRINLPRPRIPSILPCPPQSCRSHAFRTFDP